MIFLVTLFICSTLLKPNMSNGVEEVNLPFATNSTFTVTNDYHKVLTINTEIFHDVIWAMREQKHIHFVC